MLNIRYFPRLPLGNNPSTHSNQHAVIDTKITYSLDIRLVIYRKAVETHYMESFDILFLIFPFPNAINVL